MDVNMFLFTVFIGGYFIVRGIIEGKMFSEEGLEAGTYHLLRIFETFFITAAAVAAFGNFVALAPILFGLAWYEIYLSYAQYGSFPPPETIVYRLLSFEIFITPLGKIAFVLLYMVLGSVVLIIGR